MLAEENIHTSLLSEGALLGFYLWGATGRETRYVFTTATAQVLAFTYDPQGNLVHPLSMPWPDHTTSQTPTILSASVYDGYGAAATFPVQGQYDPADPVGFGGEWGYYKDGATGLYLLGHRYYDAQAGRFVTRDPIGYAGGMNLYGFAGNNPVNESDPSGTSIDPKPGAGPNWVRVSTALFIPMPEFLSGAPHGGGVVTNKGDGRSFDPNTNADRARIDFALNTVTGQLITYKPHTAGSTMTYLNGHVFHATASMSATVTAKRNGSGWVVSVHAQGCDPFYQIGPIQAPNASVTARIDINGTNVNGSVHYRAFPSLEIYAYNSSYQGGHKFLFGYQPSGPVQHGIGVGNLTWGEYKHGNF